MNFYCAQDIAGPIRNKEGIDLRVDAIGLVENRLVMQQCSNHKKMYKDK